MTDDRIQLLERCYSAADDMRERDITIPHPIKAGEISNPWYYYDRAYRGFCLSDYLDSMASWASRPNKALPFITVENYTTLLTDNSPAITIAGRTEADEDMADVVQAGVKAWWDVENADAKVSLAVKASRMFGIGWLYLYHDPNLKRSRLKVIHPESVLVDPDCTVEEFDPAYVIYTYRASVASLKARYKDADFSEFTPDWTIGDSFDSSRIQYDREHQVTENPATATQVYQMWYADPARVTFDEAAAGLKVTKSKKKYPKGRVITVAGGVVLDDGENPYNHGECPFTPVHAYPVPGRFYGIGDIQNILNSWIMRNRMSQMLFDQTVRSGGGIMLVGQASGIDPGKLTNAPVQIVPCRDVNAFRIESARPPSRHVFDYMALLDSDADDTAGQHDISRGARTPGNPVTAQEATILAESDRTRVRAAARWLGWAIERVGNQLLANMAQWPEFEMLVDVTDTSIRPDADSADGISPERKRKVPFTGKDLRLDSGKVVFSLDVVDSSTLPPSRQETFQLIDMLLARQIVTPEDVLRYGLVDIPHRELILADREKAAAAQPAMPQTAPPPAPDPAMMGAMGPVPEGMAPEQVMAAIEQMAAAQGIPPEAVMEMLAGSGAVL